MQLFEVFHWDVSGQALPKSLGLIIPPGLCAAGHVDRARFSSRIRHRHALTEKAWGDAVQGLGKAKPTLDNKEGTGRCSPSYSLTSSLYRSKCNLQI